MSPAAWSAVCAATGVIVSIIFQITEWKRARFSRGIEMIAALDGRFEGPELRKLRRMAGAFLQNPTEADEDGKEAAQALCNFFETLGFLHSNKVIDSESAWHFFASWLLPYYVATIPLRKQIAEGDPNVYCEFEKIYLAVKKVEEIKHPSHDTLHITGPDAINQFLKGEASLEMKSLPSTTPR